MAKKREKTGKKWARNGLKKVGPITDSWQTHGTTARFSEPLSRFRCNLHLKSSARRQGFFDESLVLAVQYAMESRQQEITQYIAMDYTTMFLGSAIRHLLNPRV